MPSVSSPLGVFLRAQRARTEPSQVGLPGGSGRRVPGLRREEVAVLAGVSADYYTRLEQGREQAPSAQVVRALCTALRLSPDAQQHAYRLAGLTPAEPPLDLAVNAETRQLLEAFPNAAAYVVDPALQIIATNTIAAALLGPDQLEQGALNYLFLDDAARLYFVDWEPVARAAVSALRLASSSPALPAGVAETIAALSTQSGDFRALWEDHAVAGLALTKKRINHPVVGRLELTYQTLDLRDTAGQQLTVATAVAGSASADGLMLLGSIRVTEQPLL